MENLIQAGNVPRHTRRGLVRGSLPCDLNLPPLSPDNLTIITYEQPVPLPPGADFSPATRATDFGPPATSTAAAMAAAAIATSSASGRPPALLARMREFLLQQAPYDDQDGDYDDYDYELDSSTASAISDFADAAADGDDGDPTDVSASVSYFGLDSPAETGFAALSPHVELMPDGQRVETFPCGGFITKDVLGRVTEVRSGRGETLWLRYSAGGKLESFVRTDSRGRTHSRGEADRHGVVVRDQEGRVRASGVSMTVDPLGCFYLHTQDGQFFAVDLIHGFHVERRMAAMHFCRDKYITAFFSRDGFRMATKVACLGTDHGGMGQFCGFRFYGRDGTMLEFPSGEHVKGRRPSQIWPPGSFPVHKSWRRQRQGNSAWHSLHQYLTRLCS